MNHLVSHYIKHKKNRLPGPSPGSATEGFMPDRCTSHPTNSQRNPHPAHSLGTHDPQGVLPIMSYTGRLRQKGVPFSGFRNMKGYGVSLFGENEKEGKSVIAVCKRT